MSNVNVPWRMLSLASAIGVDIAICTVIGYWIGNRFDEWMGTAPIGVIVGVLLGLLLGMLSIIPVIKKYANTE